MKITSPDSRVQGLHTFGPVTLEFDQGVAEVDDLTPALRRYLERRGFGIDGDAPADPDPTPEPPDPRLVGVQQVGSPTRDAAVDPRPKDFLAPTNAGEANPHGPDVVAPEIHASEGTRPVQPGDVHVDDPAAQDAAETGHAAAATDGTPIDDGQKAPASDPESEPEPEPELKGQALDDALEERGLPKTGTADEKRARVAEHDAAATTAPTEGTA
ncbi:hypothetical protein [Nocardioides zeae]